MPLLRFITLNVILENVTVISSKYVGVSNQSDCFIKNPHSEMKGMQEKEP